MHSQGIIFRDLRLENILVVDDGSLKLSDFGNAKFLLPNIRNGILMHTGEWPNWSAPEQMPNSAGCLHAWPTSIKAIWNLLVEKCNVTVHENTNGKLPYPYKPQGLLSVELKN